MDDLTKMITLLRNLKAGINNPGKTVKVPTGSIVIHETEINVYQRVIFLHKLETFLLYATASSVRKNNPGLNEKSYISLKASARRNIGEEVIGLVNTLTGLTGKQWGTKPWLTSGATVSQDDAFHRLYSDLLFHVNAHFTNETDIMSLLFNEVFVEHLVNVYYDSVNHSAVINTDLDFGTVIYPFPLAEEAIENKVIVPLKTNYTSAIKREFEESLKEHIL